MTHPRAAPLYRSTYRTRLSSDGADLGYWLQLVGNAVSRALSVETGEFGVSASEWILLRELSGLGRASPSALAHSLGITKGTVSKLIDRLKELDVVSVAVSRTDGREREVSLGALGRAMLPTLVQAAQENDERFFGHIAADERERIVAALKLVASRHALRPVPRG
jgi:DNA-binding MarR family transcriptional regulator